MIQDGTNFYHGCQKFHPMKSWKVCTNWGYVSLINWTPFSNCATWETWCSVFHATVHRVKKRFSNEKEIMNQETVARVVIILFLHLLTGQILGNFLMMGIKIICLIRQSLNLWNRNIKWNLWLELEHAHHGQIESRREHSRPTRRPIYEGKKRFERLSDGVVTRWEKWREQKNFELTKSQCKN